MPTQRPAPMLQNPVIGPADQTKPSLAYLAEQATPLFGPRVICRDQVRAAHPPGHDRADLRHPKGDRQ